MNQGRDLYISGWYKPADWDILHSAHTQDGNWVVFQHSQVSRSKPGFQPQSDTVSLDHMVMAHKMVVLELLVLVELWLFRKVYLNHTDVQTMCHL